MHPFTTQESRTNSQILLDGQVGSPLPQRMKNRSSMLMRRCRDLKVHASELRQMAITEALATKNQVPSGDVEYTMNSCTGDVTLRACNSSHS